MSVDNVNHPPHYNQGGIECIDAIRAALTPEEFRGYIKGNVLTDNPHWPHMANTLFDEAWQMGWKSAAYDALNPPPKRTWSTA